MNTTTKVKSLRRYYSISEVAQKLQVPSHRLRFYESEGVFAPNKRSKIVRRGRLYTVKNFHRIKQVIEASQTDWFTLQGLSYIYEHGHAPTLISESCK